MESSRRSGLRMLSTTWKVGGVRLVAERIRARTVRDLGLVRRRFWPTPLESLLDSRWTVVRCAADAAALSILHSQQMTASNGAIEGIVNEARSRLAMLKAGIAERQSPYSEEYDVEDESALLLYALVRLFTPKIVVETGVARGISTAMILMAMQRNSLGHLHSVDITEDVGQAVPADIRNRWTLWTAEASMDTRTFLEQCIMQIGSPDIFLHDSDHSPTNQSFEYKLALSVMHPRGLLLSDDVEGNSPLAEDLPANWTLIALVDSRKCFGVAVPPFLGLP